MSKTYSLTIFSKKELSDMDKDIIVELVTEVARRTIKRYSFILDEVLASKYFCQIFVVGNMRACQNLFSALEANLSYKISEPKQYQNK